MLIEIVFTIHVVQDIMHFNYCPFSSCAIVRDDVPRCFQFSFPFWPAQVACKVEKDPADFVLDASNLLFTNRKVIGHDRDSQGQFPPIRGMDSI